MTPLDKTNAALTTADRALTLAERLRALFQPDPKRRAARLRGQAAKLSARAAGAKPARALKLSARAAGKLAEAAALEAECS
jgi:hypothetical protein